MEKTFFLQKATPVRYIVRMSLINRMTAGILNTAPLELITVVVEFFKTSTLPLACRHMARFQ